MSVHFLDARAAQQDTPADLDGFRRRFKERLLAELESAYGNIVLNQNGGDPAVLLGIKAQHAALKKSLEG